MEKLCFNMLFTWISECRIFVDTKFKYCVDFYLRRVTFQDIKEISVPISLQMVSHTMESTTTSLCMLVPIESWWAEQCPLRIHIPKLQFIVPQNVTVFGDGVLKKVMKVKTVIRVSLDWTRLVSLQEEEIGLRHMKECFDGWLWNVWGLPLSGGSLVWPLHISWSAWSPSSLSVLYWWRDSFVNASN